MTIKAQSKWVFVSVLLLLSSSALRAQAAQPVSTRRATVQKSAVINFATLAREKVLAPEPPSAPQAVPFMPRPPRPAVPPEVVAKAAKAPQLSAPAVTAAPSPASSVNFEALGDNNTRIPPDTQGAVGPNHLMVTLNSQVRIQNRAGAELSIMSLSDFWSSTAASTPFDPKVMYDPFAQRWVFVAVSDARMSDSSLLVGVTQTDDPTGNWNLYRVDADANDANWADYPSLGLNKDWIAVTVNMFTVAADNYSEEKILIFDKADLYMGAQAADLTVFADANAFTQVPALTFDNTLSTLYLLEDWNGNSSGNGFLRLSTITGAVGAESYTAGVAFVSTPNPWDPAPPGGADFAPQQGTSSKIQNNDSRLLSLIYRNGSLWAAQNAFLPAGGSPTRTAAQWWQFSPDGTVQQFGRVDDPTGTVFYAFPSLAVNSNGDVLMGFSSFSASQFASASYAYRAAGDAPSTMRTPALFKPGEAAYFKTFSGTLNRWGDYSNTVVDPANDTDFWTIQEYAAIPSGADRWGTWWAKVVPPPLNAAKKRRGQTVSQ